MNFIIRERLVYFLHLCICVNVCVFVCVAVPKLNQDAIKSFMVQSREYKILKGILPQ